jgi:hypothetical protein
MIGYFPKMKDRFIQALYELICEDPRVFDTLRDVELTKDTKLLEAAGRTWDGGISRKRKRERS